MWSTWLVLPPLCVGIDGKLFAREKTLKKLLPPQNLSVLKASDLEGISEATLCNWRTKAKQRGIPVTGSGKSSGKWSAEAKFAVVMEMLR